MYVWRFCSNCISRVCCAWSALSNVFLLYNRDRGGDVFQCLDFLLSSAVFRSPYTFEIQHSVETDYLVQVVDAAPVDLVG